MIAPSVYCDSDSDSREEYDVGAESDDMEEFVNPMMAHIQMPTRRVRNRARSATAKVAETAGQSRDVEKDMANQVEAVEAVEAVVSSRRPRLEEGEMWCVTSYFNPNNYKNRHQNYQKFKRKLQTQNVKLLTVELSRDGRYQLNDSDAVIMVHVESSDVMWQKERLLNIGIAALPDSCTKVCWLDCDITFQRDDWARLTSTMLDNYAVVQPFCTAIFMGPNETVKTAGEYTPTPGFAKYFWHQNMRRSMLNGPLTRAHPGYAWAARRETIEAIGGLYDRCIAGHADIVIANAFTHDGGDFDVNAPWQWESGWSDELKRSVREYQNRAAEVVRASMGYVQGTVYHMWHGSTKNRNWTHRGRILSFYDPDIHLEQDNPLQPLRYSEEGERSGLPQALEKYFASRKEDASS